MAATLSLVKVQGGGLVPLTEDDKQVIDKRRIGSVLECTFTTSRNPRFHRKFFALLNLGFDYWQPQGGCLSPQERSLLMRFAQWLSNWGGDVTTLQDAASGYLDSVAQKRAELAVEKHFEAYRKWVTVEAGYFHIVVLPNGTTRKEAKSISFAKMDENEFDGLYNAVFGVIWNHILFKNFGSEAAVEQAVNQLMGYA